jgi:leucyl aminopeptidase
MKILLNENAVSEYKVYLCNYSDDMSKLDLNDDEIDYVNNQLYNENYTVEINRHPEHYSLYFFKKDDKKKDWEDTEAFRKAAAEIIANLNKRKAKKVDIINFDVSSGQALSFAEAAALANYQFLKYFSDKDKKQNSLISLNLVDEGITHQQIDFSNAQIGGVYFARDLVNEPLSTLNATALAERFTEMSSNSGISIKVMHKKEIEDEGMGGLLAVNQGSIDPPTLTIMEYKPENPKNSKPIVFVGKGVVYDTGGLSLKPTANSMDFMKSDMGGSALVAGVTMAIAKAKLPYHIITLVPATDNRPSGNAYAPGDVIKMYSGKTVEVLNTDAEGRMILADALHWAKRYNPELVIDAATLTGAAARAFGPNGLVAMGNMDEKIMIDLKESGYKTYERVCEMPFWDDYAEQLKSEIADMKNIGGPLAGSITAGKFLEKFTDYPYLHLDIAGPTFNHEKDSYRGIGGTGFGVRLLFDFIQKM